MINAVKREIPDELLTNGRRVYEGNGVMDEKTFQKASPTVRIREKSFESKVLPTLREAIEKCGLHDGATVSFHHHFRNGDGVLNQVLAVAASLGRKNLNIMISSIFPVHAPLIDHIRSGVVGGEQ